MKYTVTWKPEAERRLAELWLGAAVQQALADASNAIEKSLRLQGELAGELLSEPYRIITSPPLRAVFTVRSGDNLVMVIAIWRHDSEKS